MGRPTAYRPEYVKQAFHLALLGATDSDLADAFDVDVSTVERWKVRHAEFRGSLKRGKAQADAMVAKSLYRRALGYSHPAVKILTLSNAGENGGSSIAQVPYIERYPPDTTACIFWLKNRRPADWRDRPAEEQPADAAEIARRVHEAITAIRLADGLRAA
jgi:hypothetical protein